MRLFLTLFMASMMSLPLLATEKSASYLCRKQISYTEKKMGIPAGLLAAISIVESGKQSKEHKDLVAWPWVINVKGKPEYHKTKTDAVKALTKHLDAGVMNVDVGCMQINFRHHGAEFRSPSYMIDPQRNVAYAAKFLLALHKKHGSWTKAVGHYHSATLKHQVPYRHKVYNKWQKVRHAESQQKNPQQNSFVMADVDESKMSAQGKRLLRPLNKNPGTRQRGYEIIRAKKPTVTLQKTKQGNPINSLVHPNDRAPHDRKMDSSLQALLLGRTPSFFKKES